MRRDIRDPLIVVGALLVTRLAALVCLPPGGGLGGSALVGGGGELWVLLFVGAVVRFASTEAARDWLLAALFLVLPIWTKTVPLCLAPILVYGARRLPPATRAVGLYLALMPVVIAMGAIYVLAPAGVSAHVLGYRSSPGFFGLSGLLSLTGLQEIELQAGHLFPVVMLLVMAGLGIRLYRLDRVAPATLLRLSLLLLLSVPVLGPG